MKIIKVCESLLRESLLREEYGVDWRLEGKKYILTGQFLSGSETKYPHDIKNKLEYSQGKGEAVVVVVATAIYTGVGIYESAPVISAATTSLYVKISTKISSLMDELLKGTNNTTKTNLDNEIDITSYGCCP